MSDNLENVLDGLAETADGDKTSLGEVLDAFENRSVGALLTLFGGLAAIPVIGGLPGASLVIGTLIVVAIAQTFFGNGGVWAPDFLREKEVDSDRIDDAVEKAKPWVKRIDRVLKNRLGWLIDGKMARVAVIACALILAFAFFPLALVPWGAELPALATLAFGLAMIGKDGLFALVGYVLTAATIGMASFAI